VWALLEGSLTDVLYACHHWLTENDLICVGI
jgi:hypothetical protein